eukprot:scaffold114936_cov19-Tisochrysis_lutea.AAC.2
MQAGLFNQHTRGLHVGGGCKHSYPVIARAGKGFGGNSKANVITPCPCGNKKQHYKDCCQPIISSMKAESPEALLKARFSAYAKDEEPFLFSTFDPAPVNSVSTC